MTPAWSSSAALICTAVLFWKPVLTSSASPPPRTGTCPIPRTGIRISILNDPPFTEFKSGEVEGILGEFFTEIQKKCFLDTPECKSVSRNVTIEKSLFNSTANFVSAIEGNTTDIAFPITAPMKMVLSGDSYLGPLLIFEVFIKSSGYSLIMDVENFNQKSNDIVFDTLLVNTWPIFVFTLLIAGISGICVWMLVSKIHYIHTYFLNLNRINLWERSTLRGAVIVMVNGSKISIHRFITTTLFRMDKLAKNDYTHQAISTNDR